MSTALSREAGVSDEATLTFTDLRRKVASDHLADVSRLRAAARAVALIALWIGLSGMGLALGRWWAWPLIWWVQALCLVGSYAAMHEGTHGALARSRRANEILAAVWGLTILWNASLWRQFHLAHHAYAGTDRDPEPQQEARSALGYLMAMPIMGVSFVIAQWLISAKATLTGNTPDWGRTTGRRSARINGAVLLAWTAILVAATAAQPGLVLRVWLGPYLLGVLVAAPATSVPEHYGCATDERTTDPFATTRSVLSNPAARFILWQNNYHAAHHAFPAVPAHNALRLHELVADRTTHTSSGYLRFHLDMIRSLASSKAR